MRTRDHILTIVAIAAATSCFAATPDGSTKAKAIPLKQRDPMKAVEEEMQWMTKLYHYTPVSATHDEIVELAADAVRRLKAGQKQPSGKPPQPWEHGSLDERGHLISYWWFRTPRGRTEIYFDTGTFTNTPGEVARQETARAKYMERQMRQMKSIKFP